MIDTFDKFRQFQAKTQREQCLVETGMLPEEIAARAAAVREGWVDAEGVLSRRPDCDRAPDDVPGIRVIRIRRSRR